MGTEMQYNLPTYSTNGSVVASSNLDDDGQSKRTGTLFTATSHIVTAVIGSGVLSLAWAIAQLGWIAGTVILILFSLVTAFTSALLADCYRTPDPVHGKRNYSYREAVQANLGSFKCTLCAIAQYANLVGCCIGYTITTGISLSAIKKSNCYHKYGHDAQCLGSDTMFIISFGVLQLFLSQLPNFHKLWWLSIVAAVMSVGYSSIGVGLSIAKVAGGEPVRTSLTGVTVGVDVNASQKIWRCFQALGNIAFAYTYSNVLIEIQNTLKSSPPENQVMKKASSIGVTITTIFYLLCGLLGYAAFGNDAPGNFLTGFGFYEPFWLIDIANIFIVVHLFGAYQVFAQPFFEFVERECSSRWPNKDFLAIENKFSVFRLTWRTSFVLVTTVIALIFPFFNEFVGLIGAISFAPLTVYFPVEMYIKQASVSKFSAPWISLKILVLVCMLISGVSACASVEGLIRSLQSYKFFKFM